MRKIFTLIVISFCMILTSNAQNLIDYWNGYNAATTTFATGEGSQAKYWGWSTTPATAETNWNVANGSGNIRYMDNVAGYAAGRMLYIRWDGVINTAGKYYFKLDSVNTTFLTGGHTYTFTWSYAWNSNASAPTITTSICSAKDGSGVVSALAVTGTNATNAGTTQTFKCNATSKAMQTGTITFLVPTDGDYYISFAGSTASLCAIRDLSLVDNGSDFTELLELQDQTKALTLGDLSAVTSDIPLPFVAGTKGVTIKWASSKPTIIDSLGHVTRPAKYNKTVKLTATLSMPVKDTVYTSTKDFTATVIGVVPTPLQIATWNFTSDNITYENDTLRVSDAVGGFKGKLLNESRIRTIGTSEHINVLDLGNGKGYFDMGKEIGQAIYALSNHTMMGYFRIDADYTNLAAGGNYYWNFSNSADVGAVKNGFLYGRLNNNVAVGLSAAASPSTPTATGIAAPTGGWHHIAYTLNGTTGTVYIDGVQSGQNTAALIPSIALAKDSMNGSICNWLGRSGWAADAYLQKSLLYDFRILSMPLTSDDLSFGFEGFDPVTSTIDRLNTAYAENPDYIAAELQTEKDNLSLGDLSAVKTDISLPAKGTIDPTIVILWKSSNNKLIDATGKVTRPNYYNYNDTLTATLLKNGQQTTKVFPATVIMNDNSAFSNDLLVKYDFSNVQDSIVTDVAEKHFTGTLKNNAKVLSIGLTNKYNVLNLGDSIGYFDMGEEIGKLMYNLGDYTVGAYYRVDTAYHELNKAGNFLFSFSNGTNQMTNQNGYIIGSLLNQSLSITPKYYQAASGNQAVSFATEALKGGWHHFGYTQNGTIGTIYIDGLPVMSGEITNLPKTALPKANMLGTPFNWIGKSCYATDVYLRKTLVYDFRLYKKALTDAEFQTDILNVGSTISALDIAYNENYTAVENIQKSDYKVSSTREAINIIGLNGTESVSVYDISGRKMNITNKETISVKSGMYIVRINNYATKVVVK